MKNLIKILGILTFVITVVSCGSSTGVYGDNGRIYRTPDGRVYRQGEIYRTPNGDVYQNGVLIRRAQPTVIIVDNRVPQNLPPGQAKKVYGYKSAKTFAPGQQKKYRSYDDRYNDNHGKKGKNHKNTHHKRNND